MLTTIVGTIIVWETVKWVRRRRKRQRALLQQAVQATQKRLR